MKPSLKEFVYRTILDRAATLANMDSRKPWYLGGDTFRPPVKYDHLELWFDQTAFKGAVQVGKADEREVRQTLAVIVKEAVQKAIEENGDAFGALIISRSRAKPSRPATWLR